MNWKPIKGYENYYEVSDTGLVRSLDRVVPDSKTGYKKLKGKMMKLSDGAQGYLVVNLRKFHTSKVVPVHRLVAEAFIDNSENLPTVNHKDGDKHNNNVENLEWVSYLENNIHALDNGLRRPRGTYIIQKTIGNVIIEEYKSACDAARKTGVSRGMISHCLNGRADTAGGYRWEKVEECNDYPDIRSTTEDELLLEAQERVFPKI